MLHRRHEVGLSLQGFLQHLERAGTAILGHNWSIIKSIASSWKPFCIAFKRCWASCKAWRKQLNQISKLSDGSLYSHHYLFLIMWVLCYGSNQHTLITYHNGRAGNNNPARLPYVTVLKCQNQTMHGHMASPHVHASYHSMTSWCANAAGQLMSADARPTLHFTKIVEQHLFHYHCAASTCMHERWRAGAPPACMHVLLMYQSIQNSLVNTQYCSIIFEHQRLI